MVFPASHGSEDRPQKGKIEKGNVTSFDDSPIRMEAWASPKPTGSAAKNWKADQPVNLIPDSAPFKPIPGKGIQFSDLSKNLEETYKKIDKDKNGFLTKSELRSAIADPSFKGDAAMTVALLNVNQAGPLGNNISFLHRDGDLDNPAQGASIKDAKLYFDMLSLAQKEKISNFRLFNKYQNELGNPDFYKLIDPNNDKKFTVKELQDASKKENLPGDRKELVDLLLRNHSFLATLGKPDDKELTYDSLRNYYSMVQSVGFEDEHRAHTMLERQRITPHNTKLFADNSNPVSSIKPDAVQQGQVGDCFFLSAVSALAQSDPESLAKMISKTESGDYKVKFPGAKGKEITVPAPTETELILYAGATKHGAWVNMLEKAYGILLKENPEFRPPEFLDQLPAPDNLDNGGSIEGLAMLTGATPTKFELKPNNEDGLKALSKRLSEAKKNGEIAIAMSVFDDKVKPEITPGHAYTVVDFDENSITIRNSWGIKYQGLKDGLPYGRQGDDGITKIPLDRCPELLHTLIFAPGKKK